MFPVTDNLAAQFAIEARRRRGDRLIRGSRVMTLIAIVSLVGASFIPDPSLRRWVGLPLLGILLGFKGFVSYRDWVTRKS